MLATAEAHFRHPGGELIAAMSGQLKDALTEIGEVARKNTEILATNETLSRQLDDEKLITRKARENALECIACLQDIAAHPKGGKAKAEAVLVKLGVVAPKPLIRSDQTGARIET